MMRLGIDLGGTNTVAGLCTTDGQLIGKVSAPTPIGDADALFRTMRELCTTVCEKHNTPKDEIEQIGIGLPGVIVKSTCTLEFGTNLGLSHVCFANAFASEFSCPVVIDNDANCAALGEFAGGAGRGSENMLMVTLGTGVGGGIVLGGKLYTGRDDLAGEIGHMVLVPNGVPCNCGRKGCFETYASATGLIRLAREAIEEDNSSILHEWTRDTKLNAKMVCDACDAGDALAQKVFSDYCDYLACGLANLVNVFQPDSIVIGGGVAGYGEKLFVPLRERVHAQQFHVSPEGTPIRGAALGNDAGIIGAALL